MVIKMGLIKKFVIYGMINLQKKNRALGHVRDNYKGRPAIGDRKKLHQFYRKIHIVLSDDSVSWKM